MAFFKFRKGGDDQATPAPQPESVEVMRRRAKHRLIGAAVLVLAGVIGFPLLVDKQPRPIAVDIPIEIPDKAKVKPLQAETAAPAVKSDIITEMKTEAPAPAKVADKTQDKSVEKVAEKVADKAPEKPADKAADKPAEKGADKAHDKPHDKAADKTADKPVDKTSAEKTPADSGAKAQALLEGKEPPKDSSKEPAKPAAAGEDRYIVQVGAFADVTKAREVRLKLERAGMKTYTHVVDTKEGRRIRVRVGPFANKAEADKAADKIKKLDLPAAILTL